MSLVSLARISFANLRIDAPASKRSNRNPSPCRPGDQTPLHTVITGILTMHANHTRGARSPCFFLARVTNMNRPPPSTRTRPTRPVAAAVLKPQPKPMSCIGTNATAHSHHRHPGHERQPHHRRQITVFLARVTNMNRSPPPRGPALRGRWLRPFSSRNPSPCRPGDQTPLGTVITGILGMNAIHTTGTRSP